MLKFSYSCHLEKNWMKGSLDLEASPLDAQLTELFLGFHLGHYWKLGYFLSPASPFPQAVSADKTVPSHAASQTWWHQPSPLLTTAGGWSLCHPLPHASLAICAPCSFTRAGRLQTVLHNISQVHSHPGGFQLGFANGRYWKRLGGGKKGGGIFLVFSASGIIREVKVAGREPPLASWAVVAAT